MIVRILRGRERAHRSPVERARAGEDRAPFGFAFAIRELARELDRGFVRFRPRVTEEDAFEAGARGEFVRKRTGGLVVEQVARLHERPRLFRDGLRDGGMRVAERADGDAGDQVEISVALGVDQLAAFAAHDRNGRACVVLQQVALAREAFGGLDFGGCDDGGARFEHRRYVR